MGTFARSYRFAAVLAIAVAAAVWMAGRAEAIIITGTKPAHFGPLSLSHMQSLRVNVVHLHGTGPGRAGSTPPDEGVPVEIRVFSLTGARIGGTRLLLPLGRGGVFDLDGEDLIREHSELFGDDSRANLRIEVRPPDPIKPVGGIVPCIFPATVELFDNVTGQTVAVFEGASAVSGIEPQPF